MGRLSSIEDTRKELIHLLCFDSDLLGGVEEFLQVYTSAHKQVAAAIRDGLQILHEVLASPNRPDFNARDRRGRTALHEAAYFGDFDITKTLLLHGGHTLVCDRLVRSPLQIAKEQTNIGAYKLLETARAE